MYVHPENVLSSVAGNFQLCRNNPCPVPWCTYAHNKIELSEWNREIQARPNSELHNELNCTSVKNKI